MVPLWAENHWTLLVIDVQMKTCRYYDSLQDDEAPMNRVLADSVLSMLKTTDGFEWLPMHLPQRINFCRQQLQQCGFFVAWWMEDEVRSAAGEGFIPTPGW